MRQFYKLAIRTRKVFKTDHSYKIIIETDSLYPNAQFITEHALKAVETAGFLPCQLTIMPAFFLRKLKKDGTYKYRFFHSSLQITIPKNETLRILTLSPLEKESIFSRIQEDNYNEYLIHYRDSSKWMYIGMASITFLVQKILF